MDNSQPESVMIFSGCFNQQSLGYCCLILHQVDSSLVVCRGTCTGAGLQAPVSADIAGLYRSCLVFIESMSGESDAFISGWPVLI